jgi:hypothetical protein
MTSLKNRTYSATEMSANHQGLSRIGKKIITSQSHHGIRDHGLLVGFVGLA